MEPQKNDCPYETGKIEHCPAFQEGEKAEVFKCSRREECEDEIREKFEEIKGII